MKFQNIIPYLLIVGLAFYIFLNNSKKSEFVDSEIKTDTIYKTIVIPERKGTFAIAQPQPVYIAPQNNDAELNFLYEKLSSLQSDNERFEYLLTQLSTKTYNNVHKDSLVEISVTDSVSGKLLNQNISYKILPQKIEVKEIHITEKLKPKLTISAGFGVASQYSANATPTATAFLGLKNKRGYELFLGIDNQKTYSIGLKKDLFIKY